MDQHRITYLLTRRSSFYRIAAEEARKDLVPLTDVELKQLLFTEETATAEEVAGARAFDEANDTDKFEAKLPDF
jgi:hypothetical protein